MKKILQLTKAIILTLAAVIMLLNTNVLTAYAGTIMFPDNMQKMEDGRIMVVDGGAKYTTDNTGREWYMIDSSYPFCMYEGEIEVIFRGEKEMATVNFLDCYLTDYIETHEESEWPSFVVKGSDGVPFFYSIWGTPEINTLVKHCYDKESGWWFVDDNAKKYRTWECSGPSGLAQTLREAIENGEEINGTAENPDKEHTYMDEVVDSDDAPIHSTDGKTITYPDGRVKYIDKEHYDHYDSHIVYPDGRVEYYCDEKIIRIEYPDGTVEIKDPFEEVNTLGATVTLKTDCIKVKTNKKGVVAQKPLPKSVKVDKKALKRNKTFTVSYEKYTGDWYWNAVNAVTDEGIYRLVITGENGYEGVYKKTLYVTADKTIKAMSSVSVKVNKMEYTGEPIEDGVIKTAKIGKRTLAEGVDYTVTYKNNTDSGTGQVILTAIEGKGLLGTKTVNFTIKGNKLSKAKVTGINSMTYSPNEAMEQDMSTVKLTYNGTPLNKDTDFTVSYVNNAKAGTAKIVFTGKGLYYGTLTKSFKINKAALSDSMLDEKSKNIEVTYTGKALKPDVTLKDGNTTLKKGTDYTLTYKNNKKVSTTDAPAQITVKGKGNYTGSFKVNFAIVDKSNGADEKSSAKNVKPDAEDDAVIDEPTEKEPATDEPATEETVTDEPTEDEPATDEPTEDEPTTEEPATDEPTEEEPATDEPTEEDPATDEPTEDNPVTDEPTEDEPATGEPTEDEPATDEPTEDNPVTDEPTEEEPATDEPTENEPSTDKPTTDNPTVDNPVADEATEEFVAD